MSQRSLTNAAAVTLGRRGGSANTRKQQRARRLNGKAGGRPRRVCTTCGEAVVAGHVDRRLDTTCGAHGWKWQQGSQAKAGPVLARVALSPAALTAVLECLAAVANDDVAILDARAALLNARAALR